MTVSTICGGLSQSHLFVQTNADILQMKVIRPNESDSVLLGAAMLGASADKDVSLENIVDKFAGEGHAFRPNPKVRGFHERKYKVFLAMGEDQRKYKDIMERE